MLKLIREGSKDAAAKGFDVAISVCGAGRDSAGMLAIWATSVQKSLPLSPVGLLSVHIVEICRYFV